MAIFKKFINAFFISLVFLALLTLSCNKDDDKDEKVITPAPVILSTEIFSLASNAVTVRCELENDANLEITEAAIYWSTNPDPRISDHTVTAGKNSNFIYGRITGLIPNTTYYAKVYGSNSSGTAYSDEISFTTNATVLDIQGNKYNTVTIGNQVWMAENLKTTKFNDGSTIPSIPQEVYYDMPPTPFYCWYENQEALKYEYGALYNYPAVKSGKLCPLGWHVPSDAEWTTLTNFLGGENAGDFLKETGNFWNNPIYGANNYSGFSALPGGSATVGSLFIGFSSIGTWWTSTIDEKYGNIYRRLVYDSNLVDRSAFAKGTALNGLSVRCIKN